jgi:hypothetical protein
MWEERVDLPDDEVRYVFNPTKHSYNSNLMNILLWTSFGEEEKV